MRPAGSKAVLVPRGNPAWTRQLCGSSPLPPSPALALLVLPSCVRAQKQHCTAIPVLALSHHGVRSCWQSVQGLPTARWDGDKDLVLPGQAVGPTCSTTLWSWEGALRASLLLGAVLLPAPGTKFSYSWSPLPSLVSYGARMASPQHSVLPHHRDSLLCLHHTATAQASRHGPRTAEGCPSDSLPAGHRDCRHSPRQCPSTGTQPLSLQGPACPGPTLSQAREEGTPQI